MAQRVKQNGSKILLDIHYSDTWADPAHQTKPAAWQSLSYTQLVDSFYSYTYSVVQALDNANVLPDMIQIGNEITVGFLWPEGRVGGSYNTTVQWQQFTTLLKTARNAIVDAVPGTTIPIMLHIDRGGDNAGSRWFFDKMNSYQVPYDNIGLSFYPWWHGTLTQLSQNLNDLATRYGKNIIVAETAYPWTLQWYDNINNIVGNSSQLHDGYPSTVEGQFYFLFDLIQIIKNVPNNKGKGLFYWAPEYISVQPIGSPWENLALFDFNGEVLSSISAFVITNVANEISALSDFTLYQNYPNPFNPSTSIKYAINNMQFVTLKVFDVLGNEVGILVNEEKPAGKYEINFTASGLSSGIYFFRLTTELGTKSIKAILLK
jgi:arabinogalactan endo-1,4-beta-galactosidase